jgi:hypothetical protein
LWHLVKEVLFHWAPKLLQSKIALQRLHGAPACMQMLKHSVLARYFFTFTYTMFSLSISYFGISLALGSLSGDLKVGGHTCVVAVLHLSSQ